MSVEKINNTPIVRLTGMFLENIINSPSKSFSVTLGDQTYTLTVIEKLRKTT